jgi:hypothetical protein
MNHSGACRYYTRDLIEDISKCYFKKENEFICGIFSNRMICFLIFEISCSQLTLGLGETPNQ